MWMWHEYAQCNAGQITHQMWWTLAEISLHQGAETIVMKWRSEIETVVNGIWNLERTWLGFQSRGCRQQELRPSWIACSFDVNSTTPNKSRSRLVWYLYPNWMSLCSTRVQCVFLSLMTLFFFILFLVWLLLLLLLSLWFTIIRMKIMKMVVTATDIVHLLIGIKFHTGIVCRLVCLSVTWVSQIERLDRNPGVGEQHRTN